jgi:hypothetical protein
MTRRMIKADGIAVDGREYEVRYYQEETIRGNARFSSEVLLAPGDCIIFDADSLSSLESKVARLVPATVYSRLLVAGRLAAA